ncbi:MAG TPA: hypothetical protein VIH47_11215 [Solirubrobacterales bacterium]
MTLPLAHLGHWLWIFYVIPVLIVLGGIFRATWIQKRRERTEKGSPPK